jgi:hypothetical protein
MSNQGNILWYWALELRHIPLGDTIQFSLPMLFNNNKMASTEGRTFSCLCQEQNEGDLGVHLSAKSFIDSIQILLILPRNYLNSLRY